jgi:periplasmic protein CpxP/Spy
MKPFRLIVIAAVILVGWLVCSTTANARGAKAVRAASGQRPQLKNRLETLAQELNLTNHQKQQLRPILQEEAPKLKALRANTSLSQAQKRQQLKAIRQDLLAKIKPILTPEQLAKWQQLRGERHAKHGHKS